MSTGFGPKWQQLEATGGPSERMQRALPDKTLPVYLTFDGARGRRGLRIMLAQSDPVPGFPKWREVDVAQFLDRGELAVQLYLESPAFNDIFDLVASDIVEALRERDVAKWPTALRHRIQVWDQFFRAHGFSGLTAERQRGLFAELFVLRERLAPLGELRNLLEAWRGPLGEPHDFVLPGGNLEVKATTVDDPLRVRIHGLQQLSPPAGGLWLQVVLLDAGSRDGITLPTLVASLRDHARTSDCSGFLEARLREAGYLDVHEAEYGTLYRIRTETTYQVKPGFPSLTSAPEGILDVRYTVDLGKCGNHRVEAPAVLRSLVHGR